MGRSQDLVQPEAVLHRQNEFRQQLRRMRADDRGAQNSVFAGHRQHLDEAVGVAVGDRPVQVVQAVTRDLVGDPLLLRLTLVQAHARHFRVNKGGGRDRAIVRLEPAQTAEQRI